MAARSAPSISLAVGRKGEMVVAKALGKSLRRGVAYGFRAGGGEEPAMAMTAEDLIRALSLSPLQGEGGFFRETYRSGLQISRAALPEGYEGERAASTAIYYLLTPDTFSAMHRLRADEVYHFYAGDPVEMLQLWPDGRTAVLVIGADISRGMSPQVVVPAGVWQGARLVEGGRFALLGTTMAPGFALADFDLADRTELLRRFPERASMVTGLTNEAAGEQRSPEDGAAGRR